MREQTNLNPAFTETIRTILAPHLPKTAQENLHQLIGIYRDTYNNRAQLTAQYHHQIEACRYRILKAERVYGLRDARLIRQVEVTTPSFSDQPTEINLSRVIGQIRVTLTSPNLPWWAKVFRRWALVQHPELTPYQQQKEAAVKRLQEIRIEVTQDETQLKTSYRSPLQEIEVEVSKAANQFINFSDQQAARNLTLAAQYAAAWPDRTPRVAGLCSEQAALLPQVYSEFLRQAGQPFARYSAQINQYGLTADIFASLPTPLQQRLKNYARQYLLKQWSQ